MKKIVIASTKVDYKLPKEEALDFSGKSAGICYLPNNVDDLLNEDNSKSLKRATHTLDSGHHSVFGHVTYNIILENVPKIIAMILNNEKIYNTSEKSARYTKMEIEGLEKELYDKWLEIFKNKISEHYPNLNSKHVLKLAQENARYLISVFTPSTVMEYSTNLCQINYIIAWAQDFIENSSDTPFNIKLKSVLKDFIDQMEDLTIDGLNSRQKNRSFSLFAKRNNRNEEFGENYSINYLSSFAQLAQAQRHRTLSYEFSFLDENIFYIPPIIKGTEYEEQWLKDIKSLEDNFPQGMMIMVNERGTIENFTLKCQERLCGAAQLEIMNQTKLTLEKYLNSVKNDEELYNYLLPFSTGARCTFKNWKCTSPCVFGPKFGLDRKI